MKNITLLKDRSSGQEMAVVVLGPLITGAICGWLLGINEGAYLLVSLLMILAGVLVGMEHEYALEGFYRGLLGGLLFGFAILATNGIIDKEPKADLPDPEVLLIAITAIFGAGLGALGGRLRERHDSRLADREARTVRAPRDEHAAARR